MDAVKFLNESQRMCNTYPFCVGCPIYESEIMCVGGRCSDSVQYHAYVACVDDWSERNPKDER